MYNLFTDCACNTIGTSGGSTSCSDSSGDCTCDTFNGYTGLKCDDCVSGFYLSGDGQTCISKISSTFQLSKKYSFHKMDLLKVVCAIMVELVEVWLLVQISLGIVPVTHLWDTLVSNVMTVLMVTIWMVWVVQPVLVKSNPLSNYQGDPLLICLFTDCSCNTIGTSGGSTSCSDSTGQCTCDSSNGYSGTQCEDCVSGYYLSGDGSTCVGKIKPIF